MNVLKTFPFLKQNLSDEYVLSYRGVLYTFYVHPSTQKISVNPEGDSFIAVVREQLLNYRFGSKGLGNLPKFLQDYLVMVDEVQKHRSNVDSLVKLMAAQTKKIEQINERLEEANVLNASFSAFSFGTSEFEETLG